ncbi:MAG: LPS export ABC transporter ATP-binding protein, partial [Planctomycetota bacterium]
FGRREVVSEVGFHVRPAEIYGLLGPNGAGKTTTFRMVVGQLRPDAGTVAFQGRDVTRLAMYERARLGMGYLAQEPSVFTGLTVEENIMAILEFHEKDPEARRRRLEELLGLLHMEPFRKQGATRLSGGQRRRLEVTRALVTNPKLLMLDEPFAGIDPKAVTDIKEILKTLVARGISILITDHNVHETLELVHRAAVLYEGKLLAEGTPQDIAGNPQVLHAYLGEGFKLRG